MRRGFTLLELLVVMGIMAILLALGTVSYSTTQKKARDARRKEDIKSIQNALEQYFDVCGNKYPNPLSNTITCLNPSAAIMPTVPVDPKSGTAYTYTSNSGNDYKLCAPNTPPFETTNDTNYCIANQQ